MLSMPRFCSDETLAIRQGFRRIRTHSAIECAPPHSLLLFGWTCGKRECYIAERDQTSQHDRH